MIMIFEFPETWFYKWCTMTQKAFVNAKLTGLLDKGIMPKAQTMFGMLTVTITYGFCYNGAIIDGYSRRILWLEVSNSNNSSGVIAKYYLDTLANLGVCPRPLCCDRRTENAKLSVLQPFFRYNDRDSFSGMNSFMYGNSVSNQRLNRGGGILRRQGIQWWMCYFKDMQDTSSFDVTNHVHVECLRYCFMEVIQTELNRIVQHWNLHEIRSQRRSDIPSGKHGLLYYVPEIFGGPDYGHHVDLDNLESAWICTVRQRKCIPKTLKSWHTAFYHNIKGQGILTMPMSYKETFCEKSKHPFQAIKTSYGHLTKVGHSSTLGSYILIFC